MGGSVEKQIVSLCRHAGIDAALVKAQFLFAGAPLIENTSGQKIQTLRWRLAKVAFESDGLTMSEKGYQNRAPCLLEPRVFF